jgi:lipoprotein-releasing system ATP-binding protein
MSYFGVAERKNHRPSQLSGGEQQRVSLARALINRPKIILADEPTGNLDADNTQKVLDLLFQLRDEYDVSMILVTHEKEIAQRADRIYTLENGKLH